MTPTMEDKVDRILSKIQEQHDETKEWRDKIEGRLERTEEQLYLYKTVIRVLKTLGLLFVAIITLKFGDIGKLFHGWFH